MTRREAVNWVRDLPAFWKFVTVVAACVVVGWIARGRLDAHAQLVPRMAAVEQRLDSLDSTVSTTSEKLGRIECYVLVLLGEGTQARCGLQ